MDWRWFSNVNWRKNKNCLLKHIWKYRQNWSVEHWKTCCMSSYLDYTYQKIWSWNLELKRSSKILQKRYHEIIKGILLSFNASNSKCTQDHANRIGLSQTIKLDFSDSFAKRDPMKNGVKIGYEIFRVYDFVSVPRCCFKCRSPDHVSNDCTSQVEKCARCAKNHIFSKDAPCTNNPKFVNCGDSHTSYSLLCPVLMSRIATGVKKWCRKSSRYFVQYKWNTSKRAHHWRTFEQLWHRLSSRASFIFR